MMNKINFVALALILLMISFGCNKGKGQGKLKIQMTTDSPADFTEVNVNITEVWAHYEGNGSSSSGEWISLDVKAGYYDLLQLQNGITEIIADPTSIPAGNISQLRIILGDDSYLVEIIDSIPVQHVLLISSQDQTGLKINLNSEIKTNETMVVDLGFDAENSIIEQGNMQYRLKPVVKVVSVNYVQ